VKRYEKYGRKVGGIVKTWKIRKKSRLNSEKIWKIENMKWMKAKLNSEMIWKIKKKSKLNCERYEKCGRKVG
jgi:hypothetical protein